ncbi:MAG: hypothetical protein IPN86_14655 [Saprospiraceae bacterium]|nr:hypothetical protein [Saprospiraceae bacterium]
MSTINVKWLEYFKSNEDASESFVLKMSNFLISEMETFSNKNIDWSQMWLYFPPDDNSLTQQEDPNSGKKYFRLICYLRSKTRSESYGGYLIWFNADNNEIIKPSDNVDDINIIFNWDGVSLNEDFIKYLPTKPAKKEIIFKNLKIKILTTLSSMPHEGKFAIALFNIEDKEKVSATIEGARAKWNTQTDQGRQIGDATLERGYCHTVSFDGVEDNIAYWYIDAGSAHDGIHEFLLTELCDSGIKIKSVEIQML